eukprot:5356537-Pleurochrysis_carterae.AAC.1
MRDTGIREEWAAFVDEHSSLFQDKPTAWKSMFEEVKKFVDERRERGDKRRPSRKSKDEDEKRLASWISTQQTNYAKKACIMKNRDVREQWAAFVGANADFFEDKATLWRNTLRNLDDFIEKRGGTQKPSPSSGDRYERSLASWVYHQQFNYARSANIMKDASIREEWSAFLAKHDLLFGECSGTLMLLLQNFEDIMKELEELS